MITPNQMDSVGHQNLFLKQEPNFVFYGYEFWHQSAINNKVTRY